MYHLSGRGLVMFLLNKGADPTVQNVKGETVMSLLANYSLDLLEGNEGLLKIPLCILENTANVKYPK